MKLIINILDDVYTRLFDNGIQDNEIATDDICEMARALRLGTPIPDNATNGDVIMAMFPNVDFVTDVFGGFNFPKWWWNAPYQKGGTTRKNCEYRHENGNCLKVGGFCTSVDDEHCVKGGK